MGSIVGNDEETRDHQSHWYLDQKLSPPGGDTKCNKKTEIHHEVSGENSQASPGRIVMDLRRKNVEDGLE
jgi:hypothetical protein